MNPAFSPIFNPIQPDILLIAPPESRRVLAFQASLRQQGLPVARVLPWTAVIEGANLADDVRAGTIVRIESPGEHWPTEQLILAHGDIADEDGDEYQHLSHSQVRALEFDLGRLWPSRQWYLGWRALLQQLAQQLAACPPHLFMNHPQDIATMFDKRATHAKLLAAGVSVPPALGPVANFEALMAALAAKGWQRVFLKLAHGSSASGAVALQFGGNGQIQATTTVEMVQEGGQLRLYNSRRLLVYRTLAEVCRLIDALCRQRLHIERWLPKAGFSQQTFDLRLVVIGRQTKQVLVRLARGPITNLHLGGTKGGGNQRGDWPALQGQIPAAAWAAARHDGEMALACFPQSLYGGVDLMFSPDYRRHAVLEINAFGDYHRNVLVDGLDTYMSELAAIGVQVKKANYN
jgi:hypothetical protein